MSDSQSVAPTTYPVTVDEARQQCNLSSTHDDALLLAMIAAATERAEDYTQRAFITQTRVQRQNGFYDSRYSNYCLDGSDRIYFRKSPLASVTSVSYVSAAGTTTTLSSTVYTASTGDIPGRIEPTYNNIWPDVRDEPNNVRITYTVGYGSTQSSVPARARQAILLDVAHQYRNREAVVTGTYNTALEMGWKSLLSHLMVEDYG